MGRIVQNTSTSCPSVVKRLIIGEIDKITIMYITITVIMVRIIMTWS